MHTLRLLPALILRHANRNSLLQAKRLRRMNFKRFRYCYYALDRGDYGFVKFALRQRVEERQVRGQLVDFGREVGVSQGSHAFVVGGVGEEGKDVDLFLALGGSFGDVGGGGGAFLAWVGVVGVGGWRFVGFRLGLWLWLRGFGCESA